MAVDVFTDGGSIGLIVAAVITSAVGVAQNNRLHRAMKTNHGKRPGEYLEKISMKQDEVAGKAAIIALAVIAADKKMDDHIKADQAFQDKVEPFLTGAVSPRSGG